MNNMVKSYPNTNPIGRMNDRKCKVAYIQPKLKQIEIVYRGCIATSPIDQMSVSGTEVDQAQEIDRYMDFGDGM